MAAVNTNIKVPIVRPSLGDAELEAVTRVVRSGWLTQGAEVAAFEAEFANAVGAQFAVAVSNCTVALELALRVVGVTRGDDVVTVSHSFIATSNAITAVGARPVFADIEADTYGMSAIDLARAITPKTKAIICVHQIGIPCDLDGIMKIAAQRGIPLIEDAACAIGSEVCLADAWERIGKPHGHIACFSFHPRKIVTTGDGGMLTTSDENLARRLKLLRQHAMSVPDTVRHHSDTVVFENYTEPAYNFRLTDLQASVGRPQLGRLKEIIAERRRLADSYCQALSNHPLLTPPTERKNARHNWQSYPVVIRPECNVKQIEVMQFLMDMGIAVKRGISNAHQEPAYATRHNWACGSMNCDHAPCKNLPISEQMRDTTILIPLFHGMTETEHQQVLYGLDALAKHFV